MTTLALKPKVTLADFKRMQDFIPAQSRQVMDAFSNPMARLGFGTTNLQEGAHYPLTRLTRNYMLMISLYRSNWIVRKVIDGKAEDMLKNGWKLTGQDTPAKIDKFNKRIDETGTHVKLIESLKWARLYGGSAALVVIEGDEDLEQPLDIKNVEIDSYKGLLVFDRWSGIAPGAILNADIQDTVNFGLPEYYQITTDRDGSKKVHHSRLLKFCGRSLPRWELQAEQYWGISEVEVMFEELRKRDNTSWNIASLVFRANVFALKQKDLSQMLSGLGVNPGVAKQFYAALQAQNDLMSNQGMFVLPEDGGLETHQYGFGGISDVYENFMLDVCGATEYPMSRLFGRTVTGLGQGNEGDEHNYFGHIAQLQKQQLDPALKKLLPIVAMSTWGKVPTDFAWQFNPLRSLTNEQQAELADKKTKSVIEAYNSGLISQKTGMKELQQQAEETGLFSNITDEDVEAADDVAMSMGEEMGVEEGLNADVPEDPGAAGKPKLKTKPKTKAKAKDTNPFKDEFGSPREHVAKLMEYRSFGEEASGDDWTEYSRGDHRYGKYQRTAWKDVPDQARGRWCRVYFDADDKVSRVEMHWDGKARTQQGFEAVKGFASSAGDAAFVESEHPRVKSGAGGGQFTAGAGGGSAPSSTSSSSSSSSSSEVHGMSKGTHKTAGSFAMAMIKSGKPDLEIAEATSKFFGTKTNKSSILWYKNKMKHDTPEWKAAHAAKLKAIAANNTAITQAGQHPMSAPELAKEHAATKTTYPIFFKLANGPKYTYVKIENAPGSSGVVINELKALVKKNFPDSTIQFGVPFSENKPLPPEGFQSIKLTAEQQQGVENASYAKAEEQAKVESYKTSVSSVSTTTATPLTSTQLQSMKEYTNGKYNKINPKLRSGQPLDSVQAQLAFNIDAAIKKSTFTSDGFVYRGIGNATAFFGPELKEGTVVLDNGYISTSKRYATASSFSGSGSMVIKIAVKKGQHGMDVSGFSLHPHETEIVLPRGSMFTVKKVVGNVVECEYV